GTRRLGVLLDVVDGEQALLADRLDDGALAHAIAAADLVGIGHRGGAVLPAGARIAERGFAEGERVAAIADRAAVLDLAKVPGTVAGIAIEAGADQLVVLDHQLPVEPARRVGQHDLLAALAAHELACREQVDAGDLELGRYRRSPVDADAEAGQVVGADLGLLEQRRHQAIGDAAMRGAFAHRVHARIEGLQRIVDHDAAVAVDAGGLRERGVGAYAGGHYHQVGRNLAAVGEAHRGHFAGGV